MINSNKPKEDKFEILDDLTKIVKKNKDEENVTIENLNQQLIIDKQDPKTFNQIILHTEKDNLIHNYFHYFDMYWDARDCMSSIKIKIPKTEKENTKYWINYTGEISIYMGNKVDTNTVKKASINRKNAYDTYWSLKGMTPFFKGEIGQIKEGAKELEIRIDSIGKRFKQKIPDEFRQSYINNQNVRDAFQAICEFLGVKYICPPPTTEQTNPETDGTENDLNNQQSREQNAQNQAQNISGIQDPDARKAAQKKQNQSQNSSGIHAGMDLVNQAYNQLTNNTSNNTNNQNNTEGQQNTDTTNQNPTTTTTSGPINGYADISFDANGAIVHGSTVIEESPDMVTTLIALEEHPLDKYLEDTKNVAKDVTSLLQGRFFDTVHGNVMNYVSITIQPKDSGTTQMGTVSTDPNALNEESEDGSGGSGSNNGNGNTNGVGTQIKQVNNIVNNLGGYPKQQQSSPSNSQKSSANQNLQDWKVTKFLNFAKKHNL